MTIQKFIEKAIEGGYKGKGIATDGSWFGASVFLIPEVWQALGKVEGWKPDFIPNGWTAQITEVPAHIACMHRMIDALAEGKTPEDFIATL